LLKGEQWRWYFEDAGLPMIVAFSVIGIGRLLIHNLTSLPIVVMSLMAVFTLALGASMMVAPQIRTWVLGKIGTWIHLILGKKESVL
jgi:hypothetical protein